MALTPLESCPPPGTYRPQNQLGVPAGRPPAAGI